MIRYRFGVRVAERITEDDPHLAWLMKSPNEAGPWRDVAQGEPDDMWELLDAMEAWEERQYPSAEAARSWDDLHDTSEDVVYRLRHASWMSEEGSDTTPLEAAAAEILRLREAGDALVKAISDHNLTGKEILAWQEARRG